MSQKLLNYIASLESPNGVYDVLVGGKRKDLRGMTINEVMKFQSTMRKNGHESTAVGRYQIVADTLDWVVKNSKNISGDDLFTDRMQDMAATRLLERRGLSKYESGKMDYNTFAINLAKEWASLPVPKDMVNGKGVKLKAGDSYHKGVGSNKAHGSPTEMSNAIRTSAPDSGNKELGGTTRTRPLPPTVHTEGPASDDPIYDNKADYPITSSFRQYLMREENPELHASLQRGLAPSNVRYKDSNGTDKVGFGHKMTRNESANGYIDNWRVADATLENIQELFTNDLTKNWDIIAEEAEKSYGADIDTMDARRREMLMDVQFSQASGIKDKDMGPYVRAVIRGDFETAYENKGQRYKEDAYGKKTEDKERIRASEAQFFGNEAAKGNYMETEGQIEATEAAETIRKFRFEDARKQGNSMSERQTPSESFMNSPERAAALEVSQQENTPPPMQPNTSSGYAAGSPAAPAATPLVATPAPDIDLGGMLSKEYQSPTGEKGMLSTLPAPIAQGVPDYVAPNG